jgi:hypothetical protein
MDKLSRRSPRVKEREDVGALSAAEAVHRDFAELVMLFDRQLASLPASDNQARLHVTKAKAAAERGLRLSKELL